MTWLVATIDDGIVHISSAKKLAAIWVGNQVCTHVHVRRIRTGFYEYIGAMNASGRSTVWYVGTVEEMSKEGWVQ